MQNIIIRKFETKDAEAVSALIAKTMRTTNVKDYPANVKAKVSVERLLKR